MPLKQEAIALINNRFWHLIKCELEDEYYEKWQAAASVAEREGLFQECKVFKMLMDRIEHEAETYEPPQLGAA